jgi:carbamoyltransferase
MSEITEDQWTIAFNTGHNASIVIAKGNKILEVIELERFISYKNAGYFSLSLAATNVGTWDWKKPYIDEQKFLVQSKILYDYISKKYTKKFDVCLIQTLREALDDLRKSVRLTFQNVKEFLDGPLTNYLFDFDDIERFVLQSGFKVDSFIYSKHHESHAAGALYQSPFKKALCISVDGMGDDGSFNIYLGEKGKDLQLLSRYEIFLGSNYSTFSNYFNSVKTDQYGKTFEPILEYSGKIMGLSSYGKVVEEWLPELKDYYKKRFPFLHELPTMGHLFSGGKLSGQLEYDVAATSQRAFEEVFIETVKPYMNQYADLPICFSGGCALNIILNTRLVEEFGKEVFVGPSPNDSGQAVGMMLNYLRPENSFDATYSGIPILDIDGLGSYLHSDKTVDSRVVDIPDLAAQIASGKIYGVMRGGSENGPRALGNRSILCNPAIPDMKDILNLKVKKREPFRPFAPVVRLEDVNKYFHWNKESRWMSFCPKVREEYKSKLPSITHVDGTARVQTVTKEQNKFLYDLLTEMEKITGMGVLLNTSFNIAGKPMVSTIKDAMWMLNNTGLDGLIIEDIEIRIGTER